MIGIIHKEIIEKNNWLNEDELTNMIAIAESTPGPIAINIATFVGYKVKGFWGAVLATLGVTLPSLIIITLIVYFLYPYMNNKYVLYAFKGIRAGVVILIINALFKLFKNVRKDYFAFILILIALLVSLLTNISTILLIIFGIIVGITYHLIFFKRRIKDDIL